MNRATIASIRAVEHMRETTVESLHNPILGTPPSEAESLNERAFDRACRAWARRALRYGCGSCDKIHDTEHAAEECCAPEVYEVYQDANGGHYKDATEFARAVAAGTVLPPDAGVPNRNCPVCNEEFDSPHESVECCLWKDLSAPIRWDLASSLVNGATWPEVLATHTGSGA